MVFKRKLSSVMQELKKVFLSFFTYEQAESVKTFICHLLYYSGIAYLISIVLNKGGTILLFHSINDKDVFWDNRLPVGKFEECIGYLSKQYKIVPMHLLVQYLEKRKEIPSDWIVLTFDDGYLDNVLNALPVLKKYEAVATFYVPLDVIKDKKKFFYDEVQAIIDQTDKRQIEIALSGKTQTFILSDQKHKKNAILEIILNIRQLPGNERDRFIDNLKKICGIRQSDFSHNSSIYMQEEDIRHLQKAGMEIGSHTVSHPNLVTLSGEELHEEITISKKVLGQISTGNVVSFSYPFGKPYTYDNEIKQKVADAGYESAVTTLFGKISDSSDIYALPRVGVRNSSIVRLKVNLMGLPIV